MSLDFAEVIRGLKQGKLYQRAGWNGKGMFVYLVQGSKFVVNRAPLLGIFPEGTPIDYCPHIDLKTGDGTCIPWNVSQADALAEDWREVAGPEDA